DVQVAVLGVFAMEDGTKDASVAGAVRFHHAPDVRSMGSKSLRRLHCDIMPEPFDLHMFGRQANPSGPPSPTHHSPSQPEWLTEFSAVPASKPYTERSAG
ncbi:MAG: hypothetical protein KDI45_17195, partial [Candidatus Accumulibacter sp.]|nr:hypothetical protein [Accumulibacter sp.]